MPPVNEDKELLECFAVEATDILDQLEPELVELQQAADGRGGGVDDARVNALFRLFHTLKGSAGFLNLDTVQAVTHEAETLLDLFRSKKARFEPAHLNVLCKTMDCVRSMVENIHEHYTDAGFEEAAAAIVASLRKAITAAINGDSSPAKCCDPVAAADVDDFAIEITPDMVQKFLQECTDLIDVIEAGILEMRSSCTDDVIEECFRSIHSFKGNCGLFGYADLEQLGHKAEAVLEAIKEKRLRATKSILDALITAVDLWRRGLDDLASGGSGDLTGQSEIVDIFEESLKQCGDTTTLAPSHVHTAATQSGTNAVTAAKVTDADISGNGGDQAKSRHILLVEDEESARRLIRKMLESAGYRISETTNGVEALAFLERRIPDDHLHLIISDISMPKMCGDILIRKVNKAYPDIPVLVLSGIEDQKLLKKLLDMDVAGFIDKPVKRKDLLDKVRKGIVKGLQSNLDGAGPAPRSSAGRRPTGRRDIRVDLDKLDTLVNLMGELIISESMVTKNPDLEGLELPNFERASHRLHLITNELQDIAMAVRMVPISTLFRKMIRLVHDLGNKSGKKIQLRIRGEDTEIDKGVIDQISDPLVHMIRNAADHGIESIEERQAAGKPDIGIVQLTAEQKGSEVWIIVQEDGRGLVRSKIIDKARRNELISGTGADMRDDEVYQLIFEPGFSTAEKLTDISGRGVGMDVVRRNIEKIKGRIDIASEEGVGTRFTIRIPLTLATIEGMLVRVGSTMYTIPITSIRESIRVKEDRLSHRYDGQEFVRIRDSVYPIVRLHRLHGITPKAQAIPDGILIVLEVDGTVLCIFVDEILYQIQTVIKNLSSYFGIVKGISGCNILGNGEVALILDIESLMREFSTNGVAARPDTCAATL